MKNFPDHPVIAAMERYGYIPEQDPEELDEDRAYDERKESEMADE